MSEENENSEATTNKKERVETVVKMSDGRDVTFVGKRKLLKETIIDEAAGTVSIRLDFLNGETRTFELPPNLLLKFAGHGAEQKYGDETAGMSDVDDQVLAIDELNERIQRGEWSTVRQGSGLSGTSVLFKALVEAYPQKSAEELKAFLKDKTQGQKTALRNSARLKPIIERLEAEKAAGSKVDTDALLGELDVA